LKLTLKLASVPQSAVGFEKCRGPRKSEKNPMTGTAVLRRAGGGGIGSVADPERECEAPRARL